MASPQIENGYTKIANELLEALCRIRISGEARQVLDAIIRKTYGYNKNEDRIALSQICLLTGLKKQVVCRSLNKLSSMKLVIKKDTDLGNIYRFNKDFDQWKALSKKITVLNNDNEGYSKKIKRGTQKRDIQKTIYKRKETKDIPPTAGDWPLVKDILESFREVNPSVNILFSRKPEHEAIRRMVKDHGEEKLRSIIAFLPKSNASPYAPTITSPTGLERDLGKLIAWSQKQKSKLAEKEVIVAFS